MSKKVNYKVTKRLLAAGFADWQVQSALRWLAGLNSRQLRKRPSALLSCFDGVK